ncbi:MAG: DUF5715 family protein [Pyrinomonadaceae bacterium]
MKETARQLVTPIILSVTGAVAVWAALHFTAPKPVTLEATASSMSNAVDGFDSERWRQAVERVKADRVDPENVALDIPSQLRHYEDRHWFLATQVAEVKKHQMQTCQDFVDVATMLQRGEMVPVPAVTDNYVLFGVGARADDAPFNIYEDDHPIPLLSEAELRDEYARLKTARSNNQSEIANLKSRLSALKKGDRARQHDLQKQIAELDQQSKSIDEEKATLDQSYNQPNTRERLFSGYQALQALARNFRGRSYNLDNSNDREAMKIGLLSSLRPAALKVMEEVAKDYRQQFDRPLPVSSLIRPEQYQHILHRFNRNAVIIESPPHSTGLAFDIDYRYLSAAEQNFVMAELAHLKEAGRIEVLRERNANYHVFAFIDGVRPTDTLISASLEDAGAPPPEPDNAKKLPAKPAPAHRPAPKKVKAKPGQSKQRGRRLAGQLEVPQHFASDFRTAASATFFRNQHGPSNAARRLRIS